MPRRASFRAFDQRFDPVVQEAVVDRPAPDQRQLPLRVEIRD